MPTTKEIGQQVLDILGPMMPKGVSATTLDLHLVNDLGLESVEILGMLESLEDTFDISIPLNVLSSISTVNDLAVEIHKLIGDE